VALLRLMVSHFLYHIDVPRRDSAWTAAVSLLRNRAQGRSSNRYISHANATVAIKASGARDKFGIGTFTRSIQPTCVSTIKMRPASGRALVSDEILLHRESSASAAGTSPGER
jgi:hypothetical protein